MTKRREKSDVDRLAEQLTLPEASDWKEPKRSCKARTRCIEPCLSSVKGRVEHKGEAFPLEPGSNIKSGPFPKGSKPLKENVDKVTVPSTDKDTPRQKPPMKTEAEVDTSPQTSPPSSAAVCKQAEAVLKESSNDD